MKYRIRSGALVLKEGKLLLYQRPAGYWYFPGGQMEKGETAEGCAVRETLEETGMRIRVGRLLYIREWNRNRHGGVQRTLELIHLARPVGGKLQKGTVPEDIGRMADVRWLSLKEASKVWFITPDLIRVLRRDIRTKFRNCPRWLGRVRPKLRA